MIQRKQIQPINTGKKKEKLRTRTTPIIPAEKVWDRIPNEDQINLEKGENQDALVFALLRFHTYDRAVYRTHYQPKIQYLTARKMSFLHW